MLKLFYLLHFALLLNKYEGDDTSSYVNYSQRYSI